MKSLLLNLRMRHNISLANLQKIGLFAIVFGIVKINSVAAVFILANLSPSMATFGMIDYALALGLILAVPVNAGLTGAYPYFILKQKKTNYESVFFFHAWALSLLFLLCYGVLLLLGIDIPATLILTLIIMVVFALQIMASVILKSKEQIFTALFFDAGFFLLLNAYNLYLFLTGADLRIEVLQNCLLIYLLLLNTYFFSKMGKVRNFDWTIYKEVLSFGWPLVTSSLLIMVLTGSARIIIERFIGMEAVGIYGLYFRLAAMIVLLYQIVNIAFFKKIYTSNPRQLDRWFKGFLLYISLFSLAFFILVPIVILPFVKIIQTTWQTHQSLYGVLTFQIFFWIALALYENIIYRENLSRSCNVAFSTLIAVMLLVIFSIHYFHELSVVTLAGINTLALYFACEWQMHLMTNKKIHFPKTKRLLRFSAIVFTIYFGYLSSLVIFPPSVF